MLDYLLPVAIGLFCAILGFVLALRFSQSRLGIHEEKARARAKAIEYDATLVLQKAELSLKEHEREIEKKCDAKLATAMLGVEKKQEANKLKEEFISQKEGLIKDKEQTLSQREGELAAKRQELEDEKLKLNAAKEQVKELQQDALQLKQESEEKLASVDLLLERQASLTAQEARNIVLQRAEENSRLDIARFLRKAEEEAQEQAELKAKDVLANACAKYASDFAQERLISLLNIKNDEIKGRIIGKEGRNVRSLELILGVDIIIDDTPNTIQVSCFNTYRRQIAVKVLQLLIEDGRIQPARIEETYEKVTKEFEESLLKEGQDVILDLGLAQMHPELLRLVGRLRYRTSYGQSALGHSIEVALLAGNIAALCGADERLARRAGLLHDIGKALTQDYEGNHVDLGGEVARRFSEHPVVINAIYAHHGNEPIESIECAAVCAADALSAGRPGARRDVLEAYIKRVAAIEKIAVSRKGVKNAYAINSGKELRVILNANLRSDDEMGLLAREIAKDIEAQVQYPGEIKVHVISEKRAVSMAR